MLLLANIVIFSHLGAKEQNNYLSGTTQNKSSDFIKEF